MLLYHFYFNFILSVHIGHANFDFNQSSIFTEYCFQHSTGQNHFLLHSYHLIKIPPAKFPILHTTGGIPPTTKCHLENPEVPAEVVICFSFCNFLLLTMGIFDNHNSLVFIIYYSFTISSSVSQQDSTKKLRLKSRNKSIMLFVIDSRIASNS